MMLESITWTYKNVKDYREMVYRDLARAIENSPIETNGFFYKALAMLIPAAATVVSCAATNELKKPDVEEQKSQWAKGTPPIDYHFGLISRGGGLEDHTGLDFRTLIGTPIAAAASGIVTYSDHGGRGGNTIIIYHGNRESTVYGHLSEMVAKEGDIVFRGQLIGYSGATGYVYGPHLHFGKRVREVAVDPMKSWTEGKALTYDGRKDYDKDFRKGNELKLSAPFVGPIPKGNVDLEKIVRNADVSEDKVKRFLSEPEQYKQELFDASMKLIAKKHPAIAKELTGLPILNDGISKEEALSVWRLYDDAIKDAESQPDSVKKALDDLVVFGKDQRWNFYLQELIRYGTEKDLSSVLKHYKNLPGIREIIWGKLPHIKAQ